MALDLPVDLLLWGVLPLYVAAMAAAVCLPRGGQIVVANVLTSIAAAATAILAAVALLSHTAQWVSFAALPFGGLAFRLDGLSALFLLLVGMVGTATSIYASGYSSRYTRGQLAACGAAQSILLLSMTAAILANNVFTFLLAWELMSLGAYLMILTEPSPETVRASSWYLVIAHAGFAAVAAALLLLSFGNLTIGFEVLRHGAHSGAARNAIFLLALFGFSAKAGLVPLHVWLPMAHPPAPSHGSAILSAAVIKMGAYGLIRVAFDLLGGGPAWWGGVVLLMGATSALLGVLYALMEHDLKRLLAYHSVENIGFVFMGLGASLLFAASGLPQVAAAGLIAGVYHALNHAAFKSVLFLSAGSVVHATGTRDMEQLGGLVKRMPWTAALFLLGACAISALPPLNGFASEWLLFHTFLGGALLAKPGVALMMPVAIAALALSAGLAAACFVKAFGISFLALPRSPNAASAHEAPAPMLAGITLVAACCVALGLAPGAVSAVIGRAMHQTAALPGPLVHDGSAGLLVSPVQLGQISPVMLGVLLVLVSVGALGAMRVFGASWALRRGDTWGCGRIAQTSRMEYTAAAFAEPLKRVFSEIYRPTEDLTVDTHPGSRYFIREMRYRSEVDPWVERVLYAHVTAALLRLGTRARGLQAGSLHLYITYLFCALLALLVAGGWLR
jgi:hydrogenase-4 component B